MEILSFAISFILSLCSYFKTNWSEQWYWSAIMYVSECLCLGNVSYVVHCARSKTRHIQREKLFVVLLSKTQTKTKQQTQKYSSHIFVTSNNFPVCVLYYFRFDFLSIFSSHFTSLQSNLSENRCCVCFFS